MSGPHKTVKQVRTENREMVVKAFALGGRDGGSIDQSSAKQETKVEGMFIGTGAIEPPYDPEVLAGMFEMSNSLRPNIDSYAVNIESFGHRYDAVINYNDENTADEMVFDALLAEAVWESENENGSDAKINLIELKPKDEEIKTKKEEMMLQARVEKAKLKSFFSFVAQGSSFPGLRKITRQDIELFGNGYWEVLRNKRGQIARFVWVPGWTMRLRPLIKEVVEIKERMKISDFLYKKITVKRQFRTYVQIVEDGTKVYFKDFKDPRSVSRKTGNVYKNLAELVKEEPEAKSANEIIHFKIPSPMTPYGIPRWIGASLSVLGSRASEEVNYFYFDNKAVPPLVIMVSGGRLAKATSKKIEDYLENTIKGKKNFHKILVLEAVSPSPRAIETGSHSPRPVIEIKPLVDAQQKDGLFQQYDQRNIDKVGGSFRLPRLLRGDTKDFNRATALASLKYAEEQVFQPERSDFDFFINSEVLPELEIICWQFVSNAPITRDPEKLAKEVKDLASVGVLVPEEGRAIAEDIFNKEFRSIKDAWVKQPVAFTLAGIQTGQRGPVEQSATAPGMLRPSQVLPPKIPSIASENPSEMARWLMRIRQEVADAESASDRERIARERKAMGIQPDGTLVIEVPPNVMQELIDAE